MRVRSVYNASVSRRQVISEPRIAEAYRHLRQAFVDPADLLTAAEAAVIIGCTPHAVRVAVSESRLHYATHKLLDRRDVLAYRDRVARKGNARRGQHIRRTKHGVIDNSRMNR